MVRVSNLIVGFLNGISLILGLIAIAIAMFFYVHTSSATHCQKYLTDPLFVTGIVLFIVSLLGLIGSCCRVNAVLFVYLIVLFLFILCLVVFVIFSFVITNEGAGKAVSNKGILGLKTGDFSNWLMNHFVDGEKWNGIRTCLKDSRVCYKTTTSAFEKAAHLNFSPIESGCCKPPSECGFKRQNGTFWTAPEKGPAAAGWQRRLQGMEQQPTEAVLRLRCMQKQDLLQTSGSQWKNLIIANLCALVFLIFTYIVTCWAKRNNSRDSKYYY